MARSASEAPPPGLAAQPPAATAPRYRVGGLCLPTAAMNRRAALLTLALSITAVIAVVLALPGGGPEAPAAMPGGTAPPVASADGSSAAPTVAPTGAIVAREGHERVAVRAEPESGADQTQGVRGRVVGADAAPLPGLRVYLVESPANNPFAQWQAMQHGVPSLPAALATTAADGTFALGIRHASDRQFDVRVLADDHADARVGPVVLAAGDWFDAGTIRLEAGSVIRGRVTIQGTELPAPMATVSLLTGNAFESLLQAGLPGRERGLFATVDANGHYEIRHAPTGGLWTLQAVAPGFAALRKGQVELGPAQAARVDFALPRGHAIQGNVGDPAGAGIASARVLAVPLRGEPIELETYTDERGDFEVLGLREGPHRLRVVARGFQPRDEQPVEAGARGLRLQLEATGSALVRVRDPDGRTVGRFALGLRRWFPEQGGQIGLVPNVPDMSVRPDDLRDGTLRVEGIERGTYAFQVVAEPWAKALSAPFEVGPGLPPPAVEVHLHGGVTLVGQVLDETGQPLEGAEVTTQPNGADEDNPLHRMLQSLAPDKITRHVARTDAQGRFRLPALATADYQLRIAHAEHCTAVLRDLIVTERGERSLPPITLSRGAVLQGVAMVDGRPRGQIRIVIGPPAVAMAAAATAAPGAPANVALVRGETVSNNDGSFVLPRRLPPGTYEVKAAQLAGDGPDQDLFRQLLEFKQTAVTIAVRPGQPIVQQNLNVITQR